MNEIAVSVSRQFATPRWCFPAFHGKGRLILLCGLCAGAFLLAVPTGRNADQVPAPAPTRVVHVRRRARQRRIAVLAIGDAREAAARSAMMRSKVDTAGVRNGFEPESAVDDRRQVAVVCNPVRRGFDGPMWRFLLNEPVRPDIDLTHSQTYFGVTVTLPFGG